MSKSPHQKLLSVTSSASEDDQAAGTYTRRKVLAGAAATAAASIGTVDTPAIARSADPNSREDMVAFVLLSAALTGITEGRLAPGFTPRPSPTNIDLQASFPGSDPFNVKREYFVCVNEKRPAPFEALLQIAKDARNAPDRAKTIIDKVVADDETKYLARSIVLMWYLGSWYDPDHLRNQVKSSDNPRDFLESQVISSKAYTQGWVWRVAQAHPMGFSDLQFGYWSNLPKPLPNFIGS
jgi:hypothetical protein